MAEAPDGSRKWRTSDWKGLLHIALTLIDTLTEEVRWSFGGGTALAVHLGHRISYDVDIFMSNADWVSDLSPNANPRTRALIGHRKYEFPGNYLKLKLEAGEIDFIVGSKRTSQPTQPWDFGGRTILIETPWEIAIKKLFYRPSNFKVRDIFDLAAIIEVDTEKLASFLPCVAERLDKVIDRIDALLDKYEEMARTDVNPTEHGRKYAKRAAAESVLDFLKKEYAKLDGRTLL
jgi:hypothetical protein